MEASSTPAWVQAILSGVSIIVGILVAIWVSNRESKHSRKMLQEQWDKEGQLAVERRIGLLRSIVEIVELLAKNGMRACGSLTGVHLSKATEARHRASALREILALTETLLLGEPPGIFVARDVLNVKLKVRALVSILEMVEEADLVEDDQAAKMETIHDDLKRLGENLKIYADAYKGDAQVIRAVDL